MASPFRQLAHRPWPLPRGPWIMAQRWHDLLFAHWPFPPAALRPLVPEELELDLYDGVAWVGVIPFRMTGVRARLIPALPMLGAFPELNVRTYVRGRGSAGRFPGVYFFSLDAGHRLAVAAARATYALPYFLAEMSCRAIGDGEGNGARDGPIEYRSRRIHLGAPPAEFAARYAPCGACRPPAAGALEHWLIERYRLYTLHPRTRRLYAGDIHHVPWPLQPAVAEIERNTMAAASGITLPAGPPPQLHYARRIDAYIWPLRRAGR